MRIENGQNLLSHGCSSNPNLSMSRNGAALFPTYPWMPFFALSLLSFIRYGHCKKENMDSPSDQRDGGLRRRSRCEDDGESLNVNSAIRHQQHDTASASADHHSPANNQHRTVPTPDPHIRRSTTGPTPFILLSHRNNPANPSINILVPLSRTQISILPHIVTPRLVTSCPLLLHAQHSRVVRVTR